MTRALKSEPSLNTRPSLNGLFGQNTAAGRLTFPMAALHANALFRCHANVEFGNQCSDMCVLRLASCIFVWLALTGCVDLPDRESDGYGDAT